MKNKLNKILVLTAVLVLIAGLSAVSAASIDQNTTSIADNHADIQQVTTSHGVKEDTNIVSSNEKLTNSDKKVNTEKKSQKALKSSNQELDYYVSSTGSDSNTGTSSSSPYKTINQAISQATSNDNIYNIHVKEGTYTGNGNTNLTVNGSRHINFIGDGVNKTVLDGQVNYTVSSGTVWGNDPYFNPYTITYGNWGMNITSGNGHITIQNMNIQNMLSAGGSSINAYSTATVDNYGNLGVDNVYFYNNLAGVGAGIRNNNGAVLTVTDSVFEANRKSSTTGNFGAGIYNNGTATVYNTQFNGNIARWGTVTNDKFINITNCTFRDGIAYNAASSSKFGSGIASNTGTANYFGGYDSSIYGLTTNVINSTFINNQQADIWHGKGNLTVDNCKFENSTGVYIAGTTSNNTIKQTITNSNFENMIPSNILLTWSHTQNITFAIYNVGQSATTIAGNHITTSSNAEALHLNSNNNVTDNHIDGYVNIVGNNNTLTRNTIITANRTYTVEITGNNSNISNNYLEAAVYRGDSSVNDEGTNNTIFNNTKNDATNETIITKTNYAKYFDTDGNIITDNVTNGTTLKLGQLSGKQLKIDNVNIFITNDNSAILTDCSITIGSNSLVTIKELNINNTDNNTVITLNSQHNTVESNTITTAAANPIKINADNNELKNNTITVNGEDIIGILVTSANNTIEENSITVNGTGLINAITVTETAENTIINNTINAQSTEDVTAININKADKNTIRNNDINIKATNNATAINIEESDENMINSPVTINSNTAQAVIIQNSNNNTINGVSTDITAANASAIKLYKTNNTLITANDTTNIYTINAAASQMINIEQSNNTEISYITPRIYGSGTAINITGSYNTTIEAVNCTNTTTQNDNQNIQYVNAENSNILYIGRIVRDNFTQSATINTTYNTTSPITITNTTNIEINSITIITSAEYTIILTGTNNTLITNCTLQGGTHDGDISINNTDDENTTKSDNTGTVNTEQKTAQNNKQTVKTIKQEEEPEIISVNNYDELRSAILNSTTNKPLIINLNEYQYDPSNPENKGYLTTGLIRFDKDSGYPNISLNITINGNNQVINGHDGLQFLKSQTSNHTITINDLMITGFDSIKHGFTPPLFFFGNIIFNNVTIINNPSGAIRFSSNEGHSVWKLINCTILNNTNNDPSESIEVEIYSHGFGTLMVDNCRLEKISLKGRNFTSIYITHNSSIDLQAPGSVVPGSSVLINGTLLNDMGGPGKGLNVTLFVDGDEVANVTTDDNGKFNYTYTPKSIKNGVVVTARFNGTDVYNYNYNASEASTTFDVAKTGTNITADTINTTTSGTDITVNGRLFEENNSSIANATLTVMSNNKFYIAHTDSNGTFTCNITTPDTTGNYNITVIYGGNNRYSNTNTTINYTVKKADTTITTDPITGVLGKNVSFTAHITDENNRTVTGGYVIFKVNGVTLKDSNGKAIQVNVVNGTAILNTTATWSKAVNTTAAYSGSDNYNKARTDNGSITIAKQNATVSVTINENIKPGENLTATVNVTDSEGNIVNAGTVIFKINGKTLKDENSRTVVYNVTNGTVTLNYRIPSNYSAKTYTLTAVYGGSVYNRVQTTENFTITKLDASVALNVTTSDLKPGSQVTATAAVTDANGNSVTRGHVTFKLNDKTITRNDTRYVVDITNGTAALNYTIPENYSAKTYKLSAVFGGSNYNTNEAAQNITLSKINTNIITQNITVNDNTLHLQATINNAQTGSTANERTQKVSVKYDKHTVIKEVTIQNGVIDLNTTLPDVHAGEHTIEIVTSGNSIYNPNRVNATVTTE